MEPNNDLKPAHTKDSDSQVVSSTKEEIKKDTIQDSKGNEDANASSKITLTSAPESQPTVQAKIENSDDKSSKDGKEDIAVPDHIIPKLQADMEDHSLRISGLERTTELLKESVDSLSASMRQSLNAISAKLGITSSAMKGDSAETEDRKLATAEELPMRAIDERPPVSQLDSTEVSHWVYVLLLQDGYFYVGTTNNLERRMAEHTKGKTSAAKMVQLHPVEALIACFQGNTEVEKEVTLRMMMTFGWERVRGGPWASPAMSKPPAELERLLGKFSVQPLKHARFVKLCANCKTLGHTTSLCHKSSEDDALSARFVSLNLGAPTGLIDRGLAEASLAYSGGLQITKNVWKDESYYVLVKLDSSGLITVGGLYDPAGSLFVDIKNEKVAERAEWNGGSQLEAVVYALSLLNVYEFTTGSFTVVFRGSYPLTSIASGDSEERKNSDLITNGKKLKTTIEERGAKVKFMSSENAESVSTGSTELDKLIAKYT